ncbi:MAG: hypothetical protein UT75_C0003G0075 [Candidatus Yanofskybacteria bacterium GW2011_GWE2_40_11]|uniref:Uncharacterized protein n=1 Tax=Candidatus Yanofskybacteria bacterium GW2011_GWE2_40_11 TaxID=1619033 RepID=A0A0G0T1G8_9BACT|nr:MAG: hypothetical protein UT75_C0003G0075 [Candidatus Yanofskybacteria bacterium GW2011_GWE2_40_11]
MPFSLAAAFNFTVQRFLAVLFFFFLSANIKDQACKLASLACLNLVDRVHLKPLVCFNSLFLLALAVTPRFTLVMVD